MSSAGAEPELKIRRLGLIAGNGRFPFYVLEEALRKGISVTVAAVREETIPELESVPATIPSAPPVSFHWLGLGQLGKLLKVFRAEGVDKAIMAGQVKHVRVFNRIEASPVPRLKTVPDLRMMRLLWALPRRNTETLLKGIVEVLEKEGIEMVDSTLLLSRLVPAAGVLTRRSPDREEKCDIDFGRPLAREVARLDLGQTLVVKDRAVVAVEAMEGTDETIRRAARLAQGGRLTVVKAARPGREMRFDVPVVGLDTLTVLRECNVTALALDAGRTLMLDREALLEGADAAGITIVAGGTRRS